MRLDELPLRRSTTIAAIAWDRLGEGEARRLKELGFDAGVGIEALHQGAFRGPIACRVGRMTIALRRVTAAAVDVDAP